MGGVGGHPRTRTPPVLLCQPVAHRFNHTDSEDQSLSAVKVSWRRLSHRKSKTLLWEGSVYREVWFHEGWLVTV